MVADVVAVCPSWGYNIGMTAQYGGAILPRFFRLCLCGPALAVMVLAISLPSVPLKGYAMGSIASSSQVMVDIDRPAAWGGISGFIARDDEAALAPGNIRIYRVKRGVHDGLPRSVVAQANLLFPLADTMRRATGLPELADVTDMAAKLGAGPAALAAAQMGNGKRTMPNQLLAIAPGTDQPALVLLRRAIDAPDAPINVTLYCFSEHPDNVLKIAQFGPVHPNSLIDIKDEICGTQFY
jgi:hypothetical protein